MTKAFPSWPTPTATRAVRAALAGGVDSIEHGAYLTDETLCQLAESGAVWVPTLVTIGNLIGCGRFPDTVLTPLLAYQMNAVKKPPRRVQKLPAAATRARTASCTGRAVWTSARSCAAPSKRVQTP